MSRECPGTDRLAGQGTILRRIVLGVCAGWFSRFASIGLNLVLTPVLFGHLGQEELGLWFLLAQSAMFLGLLDFGFGVTLTRRIAFAAGKHPARPGAQLSAESAQEIADLLALGVRVYRVLAVLVFLVTLSLGLVFLHALTLNAVPQRSVWVAWTVMCFSHAVITWAGIWGCLLAGIGYVGWDALIAVAVGTATLLAQIATVLAGGGLAALAVAAAVGGFATRYLTLAFARSRQPELFRLRGSWKGENLRTTVPPALKAWLTVLAAFLSHRTDQYFIAYFRSAGDIPAYQAAYQIVSNLYTLAISFAVTSSVFVSQLWQSGDLPQIHEIVRRNLRLALSIMASGVVVLGLAGRDLISLWLGSEHFVGYPVLLTFCFMLTFNAQHTVVAIASRATENEVYAPCTFMGALLNLILTWRLIGPLGLWGVALGTFLAQLFTLDWYVLRKGFARLGMSLRAYLRGPLLELAAFSAITLGAAWVLRQAGGQLAGPPGRLPGTVLASGLAFLLFLWWRVLERSHRVRTFHWIRAHFPTSLDPRL